MFKFNSAPKPRRLSHERVERTFDAKKAPASISNDNIPEGNIVPLFKKGPVFDKVLDNKMKDVATPANDNRIIANDNVAVEVAKSEVMPAKDGGVPVAAPEKKERPLIPTKKQKIRATIVEDSRRFESEAHDTALKKMSADKAEMGGWKNLPKRMWRSITEENRRQKEIIKAKAAMEGSGSLFEDGDASASRKAKEFVVKRFALEYENDEVLSKEESREVLDEKSVGEGALVYQNIKELLFKYAEGNMPDEAFEIEKARIIAGTIHLDQEKVKRGLHHADNLLEIAKGIKQSIEHGEGIERLDIDFEVVVGRAKSGVRTEAQYNTVDRLKDKLRGTKVGRILNETTLAYGVAAAYTLTVGLSQRVALSNATAWGTFGLSAGIAAGLAWMRADTAFKNDRQQHYREVAKGKTFNRDRDVAPQRNEMEQFRYASIPASEQIALLTEAADAAEISPADFTSHLKALVETNARIRISDAKDIDLFTYSDERLVDEERFQLDLKRAEAKVNLKKLAETLSASNPELLNGTDFDTHLRTLVGTREKELMTGAGGVDEKDRLAKKARLRKGAATGAKTLVIGAGIGLLAQEVLAWASENQKGLIDGLRGKREAGSTTALEALRSYIVGEAEVPLRTLTVHGNTISLPENITIVEEAAGAFTLVRDGKPLASGLMFDNGSLTEASSKKIAEAGAEVIERSIDVSTTKEPAAGSAVEMAQERPDIFTRITRAWYDNNTSAPVFEGNELRLKLGGVAGTGVDVNKNVVLDVSSMTAGGSRHGAFSVNALEAIKEGKLKMLFSLSRNSQAYAMEIPIDSTGKVVIDFTSSDEKMKEIAKLFEIKNGKAVFKGGFIEVAHEVADNKNPGATKQFVLATHKGPGTDTALWERTVTTTSKSTTVSFDHFSESKDIDPPPFIPILSRYPLERTQEGKLSKKEDAREVSPIAGYAYGYHSLNKEERRAYEDKFSPALRSRPGARLDHVHEAQEYLKKQEEGYEEILKRSSESLGAMSDSCKLSVCIPVAGHQEGDNIYRTLTQYLNQTAPKDSYEIVLFVNRPDVDPEGKEVLPDSTIDEIQRFKKDHPELPVRVMESVLPRDQARIGRIRKILNDTVLYRHNKRGSSAQDHIFVSNDADLKGISPEYISNFVTKFEGNPQVDAMLGQIDWDPHAYVRNPLVHVGTRLFQYVETQLRQRDKKSTGSSGANFAFRSSIYSAVGGYSGDMTIVEDVDFGRRIKYARLGARNRTPIAYAGARTSRIYTSARRAEHALKNGLAPVEQWNRGFGAFDDEVRKVRWEDGSGDVDFNDPIQVKELKKNIEVVINRTLAAMKDWGGTDKQVFGNALRWLGIGSEVDKDGKFSITNMDSLIAGLKSYKEEGLKIMDRKITPAAAPEA